MFCILGMDLLAHAQRGELNEVERLIQEGTNVNTVTENGQTALFLACENGHYDVAKFLLENKALVNYKAKPLIAAARNDHTDCVDLLLKHGADVKCKNGNGKTALFFALQKMNVSIILSLIDHGVRPQMPLRSLLPKLFSCANGEHAGMFCKLLNSRSLSLKSDASLVAAFQFAFKHSSLQMASDLMSRYLGSNVLPVYPLAMYYSVMNKWYHILADLLKKEACVKFVKESSTLLCAACEYSSDETVQLLLQYGADPNLLCEDPPPAHVTGREPLTSHRQNMDDSAISSNPLSTSGATGKMSPLLVACRRGALAIAKTLLGAGADPNIAVFGSHPLSVACRHRYHDVVELLLLNGAHVHVCDEHGKFPLHHALEAVSADHFYPDLSTVNQLLDYGADPNAITSSGETPLYIACSKGLKAVLRMLECGAKVNIGNHPLSVACKHRHNGVVELLLLNGADVHVCDEDGKFPLHHALESVSADDVYPNFSTVNLLLDCGADPNAVTSSGETPLYIACSKGLLKIVNRMLKCGAEVNVGKKSPLYVACKNNHMAVIKLLLKEGADPNVPGEIADQHSFPLHIAAADHRNELVTLLLSHGANVNIADALGNTSLHRAIYDRQYRVTDVCMSRQKEVIDTLLCAGADVNISNNKGETPLYLTVERRLLDFVDDMLSHGGNPNVCAGDRYLVCCACDMHNMKLVETLLNAGADPNPNLRAVESGSEVVYRNELPLCIAAKQGDVELAMLLLKYGAEVNLSTLVEGNALHCALKHIYRHCSQMADCKTATCMTKLLLEHGADVNQLTPKGFSPLLLLLLDNLIESRVWESGKHRIMTRVVFEDLMHMLIDKGACLDDSYNTVKSVRLAAQLYVNILETLCSWSSVDGMSVELLKFGAGFKLLAFFCRIRSAARLYKRAKSIRLCQAVVMAGYIPSTEELEHLRQSVSDEHVELLSWLNEDRQQVPSLMRQCRVVIRRQLSIALCNRTILPAIDQLSVPNCLQEYLKFEGNLTEVDLEDEDDNSVEDAPVSVDMSDVDDSEQSDFELLDQVISYRRYHHHLFESDSLSYGCYV